MAIPFQPDFEYDMYRVMWRLLPNFQGSTYTEDAQSIEQARSDICANFDLFMSVSQDVKEDIISRSLFKAIYDSYRDRRGIEYIRHNMKAEYTMRVVDKAIPVARLLVCQPERRNDPEIQNEIANMRAAIIQLIDEFERRARIMNARR